MALVASTTLPPPLSSRVKLPSLATSPWSIPSAFSATPLIEISDDIDDLPLRTLDLVKSFDAGNSADCAFATDKPSVQWVCSAALPAPSTLPSDSSLVDTLTRESSPLSARVATAAKSGAVTPSLDSWLEALVAATGRAYLDADAYMTPGGVSASLGWHVDDVDVLLVMLRGAKRFRVAGEAVGSEVVVDRILQPGDALYIPALTFHSGGDTHSDGDDDEQPPHIQSAEREEALAAPSTLLSVAMTPCVERGATAVVSEWRMARDTVRRRLPSASCNQWRWARTEEGASFVRRTLRANPSWSRFALVEHKD